MLRGTPGICAPCFVQKQILLKLLFFHTECRAFFRSYQSINNRRYSILVTRSNNRSSEQLETPPKYSTNVSTMIRPCCRSLVDDTVCNAVCNTYWVYHQYPTRTKYAQNAILQYYGTSNFQLHSPQRHSCTTLYMRRACTTKDNKQNYNNAIKSRKLTS